MKWLSLVQLFETPWTSPSTKLLLPWDFPGKSTGVGGRCLLSQYPLLVGKYAYQEKKCSCWSKMLARKLMSEFGQTEGYLFVSSFSIIKIFGTLEQQNK